MNKNKGITLIALVVTIVVLLILAGITIAMLTGENGIIKNAQKAGEETKREEAREEISVVLAGAKIDKETKPEYNQDEYLDNYIKQYLPNAIIMKEGEQDFIEYKGYVFELDRSVPKLGKYIGDSTNLPPKIERIDVVEKTDSTIDIEVFTLRADGLKYRYWYKDHEKEEYIQAEESTSNKCKFTNLTMFICDIKVELIDGGEIVDAKEISVLLVDINEEGTLKFGNVTWTNGKANVEVTTNTEYKIQYQLGENGSWYQLSGTQITNITNGTMVNARLLRGTSTSNYISMMIVDDKGPVINKFEATVTTTNYIKVLVEAEDDQSGLAISNTYKYYIDEKTTPEYTGTNTTFQYSNLNEGTRYTLKVEVFDNVGNKSEKSIEVETERGYYGAIVKNYTCPSQGVETWRIFHDDGKNIYLIADDRISFENIPKSKNNIALGGENGSNVVNFVPIANDYDKPAQWINENSKAKDWAGAIGRGTQPHVRAIAYMLDTNIWSMYAGEDADYAIGGATIKLFVESYNKTHPEKKIVYSESTGFIDGFKWSDNSRFSGIIANEFNGIYTKSREPVWISSAPKSNYSSNYNLFYFGYGGGTDGTIANLYNNSCYESRAGLRPIVCLKSGVELEIQSDGTYMIVK